ncbi:peptidoglycan editing factor PgeF [Parabacteroides sp. OttesenSCG-928-G06]|nr:peptidoglycan editing factor PgeF [Parabacteroides sp. OttesenSCG-928-G06]
MTKNNIQKSSIEMLQFDLLRDCCNISHFVTTRNGGVGKGNYATFNLGAYCGDNPQVVIENRRRLCESLPVSTDALLVPHQIHGIEVAIIGRDFLLLPQEERQMRLKDVDALVTNEPGVCLAVTTADCVPVLLYAPDCKAIGVVHAGWRGTAASIVCRTIETMVKKFACDPASLLACVGPSISLEAFEVGEEVADVFRSRGEGEVVCYLDASKKPHIDLWEANRKQLLQCGLADEHIEISGLCTYSRPDLFFSARRDGLHSGRMLTGIMINEL